MQPLVQLADAELPLVLPQSAWLAGPLFGPCVPHEPPSTVSVYVVREPLLLVQLNEVVAYETVGPI
jgi:hypothetical protein